MKRKAAFILALMMVLCAVLSACGNTTPKPSAKDPVTKDALIGGYRKKAEAAKGVAYKILMDIKMNVSALGQSQNIEMSTDMDIESTEDAAHISGKATVNTEGKPQTETVETYTVKGADGFDVYTCTDGKWYKYHTDMSVKGDIQAVLTLQDAASMEMTETDTEYVVTGTVSLAEVFDAIKNYIGGYEDIGGLGFDLSSLDLKGVEPAKTTYHFDKTTEEPTGVDIDMADCMKGLVEQLVKSLAGSLSGESGMAGIDLSSFIKIEAEKFTISLTNLQFDKDVKITLPDAAKNATEIKEEPEIPDGYGLFGVNELNMWLPGEFQDFDVEGYTCAYASNYALVLILEEEKSILTGYADNMDEYVNLVVQANKGKGVTAANYENGRPIFEYTVVSDGATYAYYTSAYESEESFWLVQFACYESDYATLRPLFVQWADSVTFD